MTEGVEKAWVADMAPADARGTAFGIYNAALGVRRACREPDLRRDLDARVAAARRFSPARASRSPRACCYTWRFPMPRILVTNDDGVHSDGIHALAAALRRARRRHRRRAAHRSQRHRPRADAAAAAAARTARATASTKSTARRPTASTSRITKLFDGARPISIVSGINKGYNLGDDVTYSGTVSGALEGALLGVPSIAVSLARTPAQYDFGHAAAAAATIAALVLREGLAPQTFLSLNVPTGKPKGFRLTVQAKRNHVTIVDERIDPRGKPTTGSKKGRTTGSRTTAPTTRRCATATSRSRRCSRT